MQNVKMVKLDKVCRVVSGATPRRNRPEFWGEGINWVTPKDLSKLEGTTLYETPEQIAKEGLASCSTEVLPARSVLFSSRAPMGLIALTGSEMCTNQGFKSLIPFNDVDGGYLYWCMKYVTPQIVKQGRGATFKEVSKAQMEEFEIPFIDDSDEQKRIAEILDLADDARRKRRENLKLYDGHAMTVQMHQKGRVGLARRAGRLRRSGCGMPADHDEDRP
jgi:type I restriction enzyme S subunit